MRRILFSLILVLRVSHCAAEDPFAGVSAKTSSQEEAPDGWRENFFTENFGFRRELMAQFSVKDGRDNSIANRHSAGFEVLKKFSSDVETLASVNFQGRLVWRNRFAHAPNDMEGMERKGWYFEYHNAYADFYNLAGPPGRLNARAGRFYIPFGLNLQTDTHGTVMQLSNERNFGFERDWYSGFWGSLSRNLDYGAYYLAGSGYDFKFKGQSGLGTGRLNLANRFLSEYGLEGGISYMNGQRLSKDLMEIRTARAGIDARYRRAVPGGTLAGTSELSAGEDNAAHVAMQLYQLDYLRASRRWGVSTQWRRFRQNEIHGRSDSSILGEFTWYFRNDVGNSNLHWIKLNVENQTERIAGPKAVVSTLQYYRYW